MSYVLSFNDYKKAITETNNCKKLALPAPLFFKFLTYSYANIPIMKKQPPKVLIIL